MSSKLAKKSPLSSGDVCTILKACGDAKVTELTFRDLWVSFKPSPEAPLATPEAEISELKSQIQKKLLNEEIQSKEDRLAMMRIEDPYQAEQLLAEGDLEDDTGATVDEGDESA